MKKIALGEILTKYYEHGEIFNRESVHELYEQQIRRLLEEECKDEKFIAVSLKGIKSMTVSVIISLFLSDFYQFCQQHENLIYVITDFSSDPIISQEMIMEFEAATVIAKGMIKEGRAIATSLLVDIDGIQVIGFEEREEQYKLFQYLYESKERITSGRLAEREEISNQSASNRLSRLYEKRLIYRDEIAPKQYEYYSI